MKTLTRSSDAPSTTSRTRLRQLCAVAVVVPALALAACSGESAVTADPTAPATSANAATTPATTTTTTAPATETATPTTPPPAAVEKVSYKNINAVIKDPDLGHTITATRIARHLKWPSGQPVGAEQFEIVGVRVRFEAGTRYSATLEPSMLSLIAANPKQTVPSTNEFKGLWSAKDLSTATREKWSSGWVFFKVNRGTTSALTLAFNRPAYQVSTTDKAIKAKTLTVVLSK
ncbi:hypothetical protein FBY41_2079 [Humibacillus xanthopallidus]|uniref:Uncharacterized protein n=1 Tax=Humibacillus xanthopallidus TaxID=412689 RepID=A0A543HUL5_9MICO|nr:hypothetical protein FBY41_2079 [Humibacillus xanthopallidus]